MNRKNHRQLPQLVAALLMAAGVADVASFAAAATPFDQPAGATWVVGPTSPGEDLPPVGRSLFDFLATTEQGGRRVYDLPFPFAAMIGKLEAQAGRKRDGTSPLRQILIPLGRSLQRTAATPDFFAYPRVMVMVDGESALADAWRKPLLKDRVYLGYQEKSSVIEVISYNEAAARFEFQLVKDYRAGGTPRVFYAHRSICMACHQNQAPIFSRQVWDETNANPRVAALLGQQGRDFYGIPLAPGIDVPNAIDDAVRRANLLSAYQLLWRGACDAAQPDRAAACRAALVAAALQLRLSGERGFDQRSRRYREDFLAPVSEQWTKRWPGGLAIPDAGIPNRNPFLAQDVASPDAAPSAHVPARFEALNPRPPLETWSHAKPGDVQRVVAGIAGFFAEADIAVLDRHLFAAGNRVKGPRRTLRTACSFRLPEASAGRRRADFVCNGDLADGGPARVAGRIYVDGGKAVSGAIDRLDLGDGVELGGFSLPGSTPVSRSGQIEVGFSPMRSGLHLRRADGNAVERIDLRLPPRAAGQGGAALAGELVITLLDDFPPVLAALTELARQSAAGGSDALSPRPFRRAALVPALLALLGHVSGEAGGKACCVDAADLPPARVEEAIETPAQVAAVRDADPDLGRFYRYCALCHLSKERFPPNFLHGDAAEVRSRISHCAERILFRLGMWQLPPEDRPKTPMPPMLAVHRLDFTSERWAGSAERAQLARYAAELAQSNRGTKLEVAALLVRNYESLRSCLPEQ